MDGADTSAIVAIDDAHTGPEAATSSKTPRANIDPANISKRHVAAHETAFSESILRSCRIDILLRVRFLPIDVNWGNVDCPSYKFYATEASSAMGPPISNFAVGIHSLCSFMRLFWKLPLWGITL